MGFYEVTHLSHQQPTTTQPDNTPHKKLERAPIHAFKMDTVVESDRKLSFAWVGTFIQPYFDSKIGSIRILHNHTLAIDHEGKFVCFQDNITSEFLFCEPTSLIQSFESEMQFLRDHERLSIMNENQFMIPGFVDCHIHAPQHAYTGTATDVPLMAWLEKYTFPSEMRLQDLDASARVYERTVSMLLSNGTTTALYFGTLHTTSCKVLANTTLALGQRALIGKVCMDQHAPSEYVENLEENIAQTNIFIDHCAQEEVKTLAKYWPSQCAPKGIDENRKLFRLLTAVVTPRFLPTCSERLLKSLGELATQRNVPIQSHLSESRDVMQLCEALREEYQGSTRDVEVFQRCGLLTASSVMAHGVHLNHDEMELLAASGTSIAHCPLSNAFFAGGVFPVRDFLRRGGKVGLGSDVAGGYSPSMLVAIRQCVISSRMLKDGVDHYHRTSSSSSSIPHTTDENGQTDPTLDYKEAFYLATQGGADCLGLGDLVGSFAMGKACDVVLVDVSKGGTLCPDKHDSFEDLFQKFVNLGDDRHIASVWVHGRKIY